MLSLISNKLKIYEVLLGYGIFSRVAFNLSITHNVIAKTLHGIYQSFEKFSTHLKTDNPVSNLRGEPIKPVFQVRSV